MGKSGFYFLKDVIVEGMDPENGSYLAQIYLDFNRIGHFLQGIACEDGREIVELMSYSKGIREAVHSISIWLNRVGGDGDGDNDGGDNVTFRLKFRPKDSYDVQGTFVTCDCKVDGSENRISMSDVAWSAVDGELLTVMQFAFATQGRLVVANVVFHLNDGYGLRSSDGDGYDLYPSDDVNYGTQPSNNGGFGSSPLNNTRLKDVDTSSKAYKDMINDSFIQAGNTKRLKAALDKARSGGEMTIAFIGGSITQGAHAKPINKKCYAYLTYVGVVENYSNKGIDGGNIRFVKAGVGGTPSELGLVRYDRDVCADGAIHPDIVVVEFAVNDSGDELDGGCYESLVRKIYNSADRPAVVLIFSVFEDDYNLQERLIPIGRHYKIPMVSVKDAVVPRFNARGRDIERGIINRRQFFYDFYHPSNTGHMIMADCLLNLFDIVDKGESTDEPVDFDNVIYSKAFEDIISFDKSNVPADVVINVGSFTGTDTVLHMVERDANPFHSPEFPNNWQHIPETGNLPFALKLRCKALIMVFKDSGDKEVGTAAIYIDGDLAYEANPHLANWTHCNAKILINDGVSKEHEVVVRMKEGDEGRTFTILGFGYVE